MQKHSTSDLYNTQSSKIEKSQRIKFTFPSHLENQYDDVEFEIQRDTPEEITNMLHWLFTDSMEDHSPRKHSLASFLTLILLQKRYEGLEQYIRKIGADQFIMQQRKDQPLRMQTFIPKVQFPHLQYLHIGSCTYFYYRADWAVNYEFLEFLDAPVLKQLKIDELKVQSLRFVKKQKFNCLTSLDIMFALNQKKQASIQFGCFLSRCQLKSLNILTFMAEDPQFFSRIRGGTNLQLPTMGLESLKGLSKLESIQMKKFKFYFLKMIRKQQQQEAIYRKYPRIDRQLKQYKFE